jgi:ferredoxin
MTPQIQEIARRWLGEGLVDVFVGFRRHPDGSVIPVEIRDRKDAEQLVWGDGCVHNLMSYIDLREKEKVGVLLKGCDGRALVQLLVEGEIDRDRVKVLGVVCPGLKVDGSLVSKCETCRHNTPPVYDELVQGDAEPWNREITSQELTSFEQHSPQERMAFFKEQFDRCIRCYACRDICPLCYCEECVTDKSLPQWVEVGIKPSSNFYWHLIRAFHLAGRCVECGECDRACPVGIPLRLLNEKMARQVESLFEFSPGMDPEGKPVLLEFKEDEEHLLDHGAKS